MTVTCRRDGFVGYVQINNPPVNAIEAHVRKGLLHAVRWAESEDLDRVILSGTENFFATGDDTKDLNEAFGEPHLPNLLVAIETSYVPWIAAIDGDALGGGAEIALACRMRIINPSASLGFPEVTQGITSGIGGTQRLPRLIGFQSALDMLITGEPVDASTAKKLGLVDDIDIDPIDESFMVNTEELLCRVPAIELPTPVIASSTLIGNRILTRYEEAANTVLIDGSTPWEIDEAMVEFGFVMGPYEAQDLEGLDIALVNRHAQNANRDSIQRSILIVERLLELGKLGRKTGAGWYRYPGGKGKVDDPIVADIAIEEAHFAGIKRIEYSAEKIRERLLLSMINEAATILHEGLAQSAQELDLISVLAYGFPPDKGGLMRYADSLGVDHLIKLLSKFQEEDATAWQTSALLEECASRGVSIREWCHD